MTRSTCYANIRITCGEGDPSFLCREKELALHQQQKGAEASAAAYTICETAKANGLNVYRYNVGAGEKDNPDSRISGSRATESFYYLNPDTGESLGCAGAIIQITVKN